MARRRNNTTALAVGLGILAGVLFLRKPAPVFPSFPAAPPPPPRNSPEWQDWAQRIIGLYGTIAALWEPGGPFYNPNDTDELFDGNLDPNAFGNVV